MRANQLRLYFCAFAYVLLDHLRRLGLRNTSQRRAYVGTIRLRYLKIVARVKVTARRVWLSFSEAYLWKSEFDAIARNLNALPSHAHALPDQTAYPFNRIALSTPEIGQRQVEGQVMPEVRAKRL